MGRSLSAPCALLRPGGSQWGTGRAQCLNTDDNLAIAELYDPIAVDKRLRGSGD